LSDSSFLHCLRDSFLLLLLRCPVDGGIATQADLHLQPHLHLTAPALFPIVPQLLPPPTDHHQTPSLAGSRGSSSTASLLLIPFPPRVSTTPISVVDGAQREVCRDITMVTAMKRRILIRDSASTKSTRPPRTSPHPSGSDKETLAQVTHLSLVKYYGYLVHNDEKLLVVEYVPNGNLRDHLDCKEGKTLDMATRLDIATDVAHAITYLHMYTQPPIIHRDIKSSNVLLTDNFRAKVADFGFARLAPDTESGATHVSTQVKGTAGYLDPEYLTTYQLTEKSDVYSFGVLLVELLTGRRPIELHREQKERITIRWASRSSRVRYNIGTQAGTNHKVLEMAFQCLAPHRGSRPSMKKCSEILWGIRKDYRELLNTSL
ncbi:hypothetical protein HID58_031470, partial [Brassica napus]